MPLLLPTDAQRQKLKDPLGQLILGSSSECITALRQVLEKERPSSLLLVGDTISREVVKSGIKPDVVVIDRKEMRGEAVPFEHPAQHVFRTRNMAGTIDLGAWHTIEKAVLMGDSVVFVEGEEDLLALVVIWVAPSGSLVVYGQPNQGIVLVRVSPEKKNEIGQIIEQMGKRS